jgi:hypothetical protein
MDTSLKYIIFFCLGHMGFASDLSIMLSPAERSALVRAQDQAKLILKGKECSISSLRLDGIVYSHQKSWIIWINGRAIKPGQKIQSIRILKVTPDFVEIVWSPKVEEHYQICLKLNEVFETSAIVP